MGDDQEVKPRSNLNLIIIGGIVLGLILLGGGFIVGNQSSTQELSQNQENDGQSEVAGVSNEYNSETQSMEEEVKVVQIEAGSFYYNPKEIRVKLGEKVKIVLKAVDMMHDFNIDELGIDGLVIKSGETTTVEFTADKVGKFEYYCSVGQHRNLGQVGTLFVEE